MWVGPLLRHQRTVPTRDRVRGDNRNSPNAFGREGAALVHDGTIVPVGPRTELEPQRAPTTPVLDFPDSTLLPGLINCHVGGRAPRPRGRRKEPAPDHPSTCPRRAGWLRDGAGRHPAGGMVGSGVDSPSVGAAGHRLPPPVPGLGRRRDQARGYGPGGRWPGRSTQPSSGRRDGTTGCPRPR
jgi:hypothetical protein